MRTPEHERLFGADDDASRAWRRFGPYLSERQWGTVREDYSPHGTAWDSFPHDLARSRVYRWGEDGLAGWSDEQQLLCLGLALWNARDPILKERLFGLTGPEGNHGEDVKELYYYLDATPSHAYQRMLYKYPQSAFPYDRLVAGNRTRGRSDPELELIDTGVFDEDRYFDVFVEYAKHEPEDILMRVLVCNRGAAEAPITVIPQAWFRNTWSWGRWPDRPTLRAVSRDRVELSHPVLGAFVLHCDDPDILAVCDNETNHRRVHGVEPATGFFKDGLHEYVVRGDERAINLRDRARRSAPCGAVSSRLTAKSRFACGWRAARSPTRSAGSTRSSSGAAAKPMRSMTPCTRRTCPEQSGRCSGRPWPVCCGASSSTPSMCGSGWRATPDSPSRPAARRQGRNRDWVHLNNADILSMGSVYEDIATKFFEHFLYIAGAMRNVGGQGLDLWDEADGFFYDVLHCDGLEGARCESVPLRVRSLVGLVPLFAVETLDADLLARLPGFHRRLDWFLQYRPDLAALVSRWETPGAGSQHLLSLLRGHRMKQLLRRMLDETEFLSEFGVRALSKYHRDHPYRLEIAGTTHTVSYQPGESDSGMFGGNSNWRGPIWMPVNYLLVESLRKFHRYYGPDFLVECPTGSGVFLNLAQIADELSARLSRLFLPDTAGRRPCLGLHPKLERDPHFRDHLLFHEYFHGDDGRGVGASHQTGWTALIATLLAEMSPTAAAQAGERAPSSPGRRDRR